MVEEEVSAAGYTDELLDGAFSFVTAPLRRLQVYPTFNNPDQLFNQDPPSNTASFIIGFVLFVIGSFIYIHRVKKLMQNSLDATGQRLRGADLFRGMLAVLNDNDSSIFTIITFSATSFLFLGGIQTEFESTFFAMIIIYFFASLIDTLRVVLAYGKYNSLKEVTLFTTQTKDVQKEQQETDTIVELQPTNIYEDFGRDSIIVYMIFFTQLMFVSIVCYDIYSKGTNNCLDGTKNCPVGMTLGSYGFYIIGIFQACVYMLGPKTSFGQSEQNPGFWMIMLLSTKNISEGEILWHNPYKDASIKGDHDHGKLYDENNNQILNPDGGEWFMKRETKQNDGRMWRRFFMSFLVNGVGYHILIHALPLQVAQQTSYLSVVFRAVGMMYLVDLDDSKGFKLYITAKYSPPAVETETKDGEDAKEEGSADEEGQTKPRGNDVDEPFDEPPSPANANAQLEADKQAIIDHARAEVQKAMDALDALSRGEKPSIAAPSASHGGRKSTAFIRQSTLMTFGTNATLGTVNEGDDKADDDVKKNTSAAAALQASSSGEGQGVEVSDGGPV